MNDTIYGPLNTTIRSKENNLLSKNHLERMIGADSYTDAMSVLRETTYRNDVDEIQASKNYDEMFMKELEEAFKTAFEAAPDADVIEVMALRYAYHNLKVLFKEDYLDDDLSHLYIPIGRYDISELRKAVKTGKSTVLPQMYLDSIIEMRRELDEYDNPQSIDILLDRCYFNHLKKLAEQTGEQEIVELVTKKIDFYNISTLIRAKRQNRGRNFLSTILSDAGSFNKEDLIRQADSGIDGLIDFIKRSRYKAIVEALDLEDEHISVVLDRAFDNAYMTEMKKARLMTFGPLPVLAFLYAKETEVMNLRLILSGKENNIDTELIRERMRLSYGQ